MTDDRFTLALVELGIARAIAILAHKGQFDKAGVEYYQHPRAVAATLVDIDDKIVALLHDVLEDSAFNANDLRRCGIAAFLVEDVVLLTRTEAVSDTEYYAGIRKSPRAKRVKTADVKHNMSPERLAFLEATTRDRLILKYTKALAALGEDGG